MATSYFFLRETQSALSLRSILRKDYYKIDAGEARSKSWDEFCNMSVLLAIGQSFSTEQSFSTIGASQYGYSANGAQLNTVPRTQIEDEEVSMNEITTRKIAADFNLLVDDVEELIKATADQTGEHIVALRQRLEKKIEDTRKSLAEQACQFAGEAKASIESRLRQDPWSALVVAAGIAFLSGLLLRRK